MEKRPGGWFHCQDCHHSWQPSPVRFGFVAPPRKQTVFETLIASPEVLAEVLVFCDSDGVYWHSTIVFCKMFPDCFEDFNTKAEAIAATVAKLKEVAK